MLNIDISVYHTVWLRRLSNNWVGYTSKMVLWLRYVGMPFDEHDIDAKYLMIPQGQHIGGVKDVSVWPSSIMST